MSTRLTRFTLLLTALILPTASWAARDQRSAPRSQARPAAKTPRLGSFTGAARGAAGVSPTTARFIYRKARGKLYWEASSPKPDKASPGILSWTKPNLRQSFDVVSDRTTSGGTRVIEYVRPTRGRSARYNERKLTEFFGMPVSAQAGKGQIIISPDGHTRWHNVGTMVARPVGKASVANYKWTELFEGERSPRSTR